ncbi:hypothetical protein C1Y40_04172 [Mycobacterium talmoniae]|uniref:CBS domain-containing protein n=1 Tax=Mycobacterium talmoniae TaxID=1858794 RepID=A0A2S8BG68_9MYCO|nr:hypothetical protein C1Y40_04172 [Mycobacterium talmoniae]
MERALAETGYSRFPVVDPDGRFVGYLHIKDLLALGDDPDAVLDLAAVRPLPQLPVSLPVPDALSRCGAARATWRWRPPRPARWWRWSPWKTWSRTWSARCETEPTVS